MDLRTGRMYTTKEDARAAGVPESDIAEVLLPSDPLNDEPEVKFARSIHHFIKITVEAKETVFEAIDLNGAAVETFRVSR